jgi:hypothetical protein
MNPKVTCLTLFSVERLWALRLPNFLKFFAIINVTELSCFNHFPCSFFDVCEMLSFVGWRKSL